MSETDQGGDGERSRLDRELIELLNELRVVLPGIQVLFAFLLIVPFNQRFTQVTSTERTIYFISLVATTLASIMLIAPTAQHRVRWRAGDKETLLQRSNQLAIAGMAFLTVGIAAAVFVVTEFVYRNTAAEVITAVVAAIMIWFWFGQPLVAKYRKEPSRR